MRMSERIAWMLVLGLLVVPYFHKKPVVAAVAPPPIVIQASNGVDKPCLEITHRVNPTTGKLEHVAANDPLGIR